MADTIWTYNGRIPTLGGGNRIPYFFKYDIDALDYISRVEAADGESLEDEVKSAINNFFIGLKTDGIFDDIKTGCLLAGARTIEGAIQPLVGTHSPSYQVNGSGPSFSSSNYNRKTGLKGTGIGGSDGAYIDADFEQFVSDDSHISIYIGGARTYSGTGGWFGTKGAAPPNGIFQLYAATSFGYRNQSTGFDVGVVNSATYTGFAGMQRDNSSNWDMRINGGTTNYAETSQTINNSGFVIFRRDSNLYLDQRISFYSIGLSTNLTYLDNRVSTLMTELDAAID